MKEKLLTFYKDRVRVEVLVFSHMKRINCFFNISLWFFILSILSTTLISLLKIYSNIEIEVFLVLSLVCLFLSIICLIIGADFFIRRAKEIVRKELRIISYVDRWRWRNEEFNDFQRKLIADFLDERGLLKKWKIENLIELLDKEKERMKVPPIIAPALFISLTVPNINQLLTFLYIKYKGEEVVLFVSAFLITLLLIFCVNRFAKMYEELKENFTKNFTYRRDLISLLEDILLEVEE